MANLTKTQKYVALTYAKYFGKTATKGTIEYYGSIGKTSKILEQIIKDADIEQYKVHGVDLQAEVHKTFQNLFSRNADNKELQKYVKVLEKGKNLPINSIVKKATKFDKDVYNNKQEIAKFVAENGGGEFDLSKVTKANPIDVGSLTSLDDLRAEIGKLPDNDGIASSFDGKTFILTASADTGSKFVGTEKGDIFKADSFVSATGDYLPTLNSSDELDGGAGRDVLNITDEKAAGYTMANATIKNIETITIKGAAAVTADVSGSNITGLETISVTKATDATITAAATTAVNVSGIAAGVFVNDTDAANDNPATVTVTGGSTQTVNVANKGIEITLTEAAGAINVTSSNNETLTDGAADADLDSLSDISTTHGTDVTVTATLANDTATAKTAGDITIGDGTNNQSGNVVVTQNLTSNAKAALNGGAIEVNGGKTVDVTVNSTITAKDALATNGITNGDVTVNSDGKTTDVTVKQTETVTEFVTPEIALVNGKTAITFKAMTAGQALSIDGLSFHATKNLTAAEVAAAFANLTASDTQANGGKTANGYYTGALTTADLTTGAANGAVVEFISVNHAPVAFTAGNFGDIGAGRMVGYLTSDNSDVGAIEPDAPTTTAGTAFAAEAKTTDSNGNTVSYGAVEIEDDATASIKTITVDGYGVASKIGNTKKVNALTDLTLKNGSTTMAVTTDVASLNLTVDDVQDDVTLTATNLKTLNLTTTGEEESAFGLVAAKVETLTIAAGADLDISTGSTLSALKTVTISGTGDVALGNVSAKLETLAASAATGDISATVDGTKATVTTGSGNDTITVNTNTVTQAISLGAGDDRLDLSDLTTVDANTAAISGGTGSDTVVLDAAKADETAGLSALANSIIFKSKVTGFEKLEISTPAAAGTVNVGNLGYNYVIVGNSAVALTLKDMANNGTLELTGDLTGDLTVSMKDATGTADTFNIVAKVDSTDIASTHDVVVADVETINITATDISPVDKDGLATIDLNVLNLKANVAKTITVKGNSHLELDLDSTVSTAVKLIDASTMKGDLTVTAYNAGMTVKGGDGNDTLIVDGSITGVVLTGGKGTDTFDVTKFNSLGNALSAVTITDLTAGETIVFNGSGSEKFVSSKVTLLSEATFSEYAAEAAKVANAASAGAEDNIAWFQYNNNTFVVQDVDSDGAFSATDIIVKINGVKDLSTASFNATDGTLEIA